MRVWNKAIGLGVDAIVSRSTEFRRLRAQLDNIAYEQIGSTLIPLPNVMSADATVAEIAGKGLSVARFGDGEFRLIKGGAGAIGFQSDDPMLSARLKEILRAESSPEKLLIAIPNVFNSLSCYKPDAADFWRDILSRERFEICSQLNHNYIYGDSLFTRCYIDHRDNSTAESRFNALKKIWAKRDVIIIEGNLTRFGIGNNLLAGARSIRRILCPAIGAFSAYDAILATAKAEDPSSLYLVALGPTATVLSYDLCKTGRQTIDIGHLDIEYEWFTRGVVRKTGIKNKAVNEVGHLPNASLHKDSIYRAQVVKIINN